MFYLRLLFTCYLTSFVIAVCPDGFYEDDCGNCWLPYCYDYTTHSINYDTNLEECSGSTELWVIPGDEGDPFFNNYCDSCPDNFFGDDCGHCWLPYCYTYFLNPPHTVYWDIPQDECEDLGYSYYYPGDEGDPYYNINCDGCPDGQIPDDCDVCRESESDPFWNVTCADCNGEPNGYALVDDCGDCQLAYCYDYVTHEFNYDFPCDGATEILVMPDDASNPFWNSGCMDCIPGDINGDEITDVLDVVQIVSYILDTTNSDFDLGCADVNADESVDVLDVVQIVSDILGG